MSKILDRLGWKSNPFEPSATGAPRFGKIVLSQSLQAKVEEVFGTLEGGTGPKVIVAVGEYGTGKSSLLEWLRTQWFRPRDLLPYYFSNPGVQFYDLANQLLRTIGRRDFAKLLWELAGPHVKDPFQHNLFGQGFEAYLASHPRRGRSPNITPPLQKAVMEAKITDDEEIAHRLATIVTAIATTPYFTYQNFVPRQRTSIVAERQEAPYFAAILNTITHGTGKRGIAFLIDEFEEIGLQKRLTKRAAHDYLATLKRLINLSQSGAVEFWLVLSMTPDAYEKTAILESALIERVEIGRLEMPDMTRDDALRLIRERVLSVRKAITDDVAANGLFPFLAELPFGPRTIQNPRRLVKVCFRAIAMAGRNQALPFSPQYLLGAEAALYGSGESNGNDEAHDK